MAVSNWRAIQQQCAEDIKNGRINVSVDIMQGTLCRGHADYRVANPRDVVEILRPDWADQKVTLHLVWRGEDGFCNFARYEL